MTFAEPFFDEQTLQEILPLVGELYYLGKPTRGVVRVPIEKLGLERSFHYEEDGQAKTFFGRVCGVSSDVGRTFLNLVDRKDRRVNIPASLYAATHLEKNFGVYVPSMSRIDGVEDLSE